MKNRRGMVLVGVMIACVVLLIGGLALHFFMRHGRSHAYRSVQNEYAENLAHAGLELAQIHIASHLRDRASPVRRRLIEPLARLRSGPEELGEVDLAAAYPALVEQLARDLPRGARVATLRARFGLDARALQALPPTVIGGRTLPRGEREKRGHLIVECTARLATGGPFGTLAKTVRATYELRVVDAPVPLCADFTLFAETRPASRGKNPLANLRLDADGSGGGGLGAPRSDLATMRRRGWVYVPPLPDLAESRALLASKFLPGPWVAPLGGLDLAQVSLGTLEPQLARLACRTAPPALRAYLEARAMLAKGRLDLGTSIRSPGALELPALTRVERGGVLMARDITITGAIPRPERGTLVLIATEGSIRVPSGVPVHAQLVALKGSVILQGRTHVTGSVAAARLDTAGVSRGAVLAYDDRFKERAFDAGEGENLVVDFARKPMRVE